MTSGTSALVLTGGGARAAYQVGVLQALARIRRESAAPEKSSPFQIVVGTSAGAINATALACYADDFRRSVERLRHVWWNFESSQVYRTDSVRVVQSGARWLSAVSIGWLIARWRFVRPRSLLNNDPLAALLTEMLDFSRLEPLLESGILHAVAVTGSNYASGRHATFYQSHRDIAQWSSSQRFALRTRLGPEHLLASSAIPFVFPAVPIELEGRPEYFGDGSMRQVAPISPAIHLGADRILIVGASYIGSRFDEGRIDGGYPNLAQIAGHTLSSIFLDALTADIERIERINRLVRALPAEAQARSGMRYIDVLALTPSENVDLLAARYIGELPATIRGLLRGIGVSSRPDDLRGAALASYLLFEAGFTQALIELGRADTMRRRAEVERFFGWTGTTRTATASSSNNRSALA